jgi:fructose-1,6-bisphosphatase/sedoheptulose 1,7-bisphosphatase-like protein
MKLGIKDLNQKYNIEDMVKDDVIFCATGRYCSDKSSSYQEGVVCTG